MSLAERARRILAPALAAEIIGEADREKRLAVQAAEVKLREQIVREVASEQMRGWNRRLLEQKAELAVRCSAAERAVRKLESVICRDSERITNLRTIEMAAREVVRFASSGNLARLEAALGGAHCGQEVET